MRLITIYLSCTFAMQYLCAKIPRPIYYRCTKTLLKILRTETVYHLNRPRERVA